MAAMTSFYTEKCRRLASRQSFCPCTCLCNSICQFL